MYTLMWFSGAIWENAVEKTAVILSHLYVIGVKIVLRVNAKYEISLKLAQYFHRKCHLNFFMNGCHAIFIKTSYM